MPVQRHELLVRTLFHARAVLEHNDAIGVLNRAQAVSHHDPLTDIFSLGLILASLACGLDLCDDADLTNFVGSRNNLFSLNPALHPVLAKAVALEVGKSIQGCSRAVAFQSRYMMPAA